MQKYQAFRSKVAEAHGSLLEAVKELGASSAMMTEIHQELQDELKQLREFKIVSDISYADHNSLYRMIYRVLLYKKIYMKELYVANAAYLHYMIKLRSYAVVVFGTPISDINSYKAKEPAWIANKKVSDGSDTVNILHPKIDEMQTKLKSQLNNLLNEMGKIRRLFDDYQTYNLMVSRIDEMLGKNNFDSDNKYNIEKSRQKIRESKTLNQEHIKGCFTRFNTCPTFVENIQSLAARTADENRVAFEYATFGIDKEYEACKANISTFLGVIKEAVKRRLINENDMRDMISEMKKRGIAPTVTNEEDKKGPDTTVNPENSAGRIIKEYEQMMQNEIGPATKKEPKGSINLTANSIWILLILFIYI